MKALLIWIDSRIFRHRWLWFCSLCFDWDIDQTTFVAWEKIIDSATRATGATEDDRQADRKADRGEHAD